MSLGIDVSQAQVSMALMSRSQEGIQLVKGIQRPLPEGVIVGGQVQDRDGLLDILNRMRTELGTSATGFLAWGSAATVLQMMELPKRIPANVGEFVQGELKQCVAVSSDHIVYDYARLPDDACGTARLLAVAADQRRISEGIRICSRARLHVEAVEPAVLSFTRAMYAEWILNHSDAHTIVMGFRDSRLQLAVFKNGYLDFLHSRDFNFQADDPGGLCRSLVNEVQATIQHYEMEMLDDLRPWKVHIVMPADLVSAEMLATTFTENLVHANVELDLCEEDQLRFQGSGTGSASAVAVGLARRALEEMDTIPCIDLLPTRLVQTRTLLDQVKWTASLAVLSILLMGMGVGVLSWFADRSRRDIEHYLAQHQVNDTVALVKQYTQLQDQVDALTQSHALVSRLLETHNWTDWAAILEDINSQSQDQLQITQVEKNDEDTGFTIRGTSPNLGAVSAFRRGLTASEHIEDVQVVQTEYVQKEQGRCIQYQLLCKVVDHSGRTPCLPIESFN
jgi:hypothetical protein